MTNREYRKKRGTDKPFNGDRESARVAWFEMNRAAIEARRERGKRKWERSDGGADPDLYDMEDE